MNLAKELQSLGLDEKEAKVYIAALEIGRGTAQEIAHKADISRPTTYFVLERLMKRGLISSANEEKHQVFVPENPMQLQVLLDEQERLLELKKEKTRQLVRELESINAAKTNEPIVKYYVGKEGILRMAKASFSYKKGIKMWIAYSKKEISSYLSQEESDALFNKRTAAKIETNELYSIDDPNWQPNKNNECVQEKEFPFPADIAVYDDRIRIASFRDEVGIIIHNKAVAETLQSIFKLAHKGARSLREEYQKK